MLTFAYITLAAIVLAGASIAILSENLIRAAIAMAVGGVSLAMLFFLLNAPHAAGFELSVGAGLISVLFLLAISLTESIGRDKREP